MSAATGQPPPDLKAFFLVGPTATGKTAVTQVLASRLHCEIVSADSMAVYRGMDIGTAKPSPAERSAVPCHCIDIADPDATFNAWEYRTHAIAALADITVRGMSAVVCGGTGLYVKALTHGLDSSSPASAAVRMKWKLTLETQGIAALQAHLKSEAPELYKSLKDPDNPRRLIRAIELIGAKAPAASWTARRTPPMAGLRMTPDSLHTAIAFRVRSMYRRGLVEEARRLKHKWPAWSSTAAQAIGYGEATAVLEGALSESEAIERTILRTRQLAKRQMTWFRNQANVEWVDVSADDNARDVADRVAGIWEKHGPIDIARERDS